MGRSTNRNRRNRTRRQKNAKQLQREGKLAKKAKATP